MKDQFCVIFVFSILLVSTNEQCPLSGGLNGNLSIVCGSQLAAETTSMEPTSAFNITNANIINTTAATLSEGCTCGHQIDAKFESLVSLRISLAIFVVISTISTIINIYFFIKNILRNKSKKDTTNIKTIHRGGNEPNIETYTELENAVSGDSENQYDSISRQENNINTNVL
uniref:Uncharacterized protein n=2 Tax=Magallana gigas TaxID=29159 RepID=A0A8W8JD25_MAGGI